MAILGRSVTGKRAFTSFTQTSTRALLGRCVSAARDSMEAGEWRLAAVEGGGGTWRENWHSGEVPSASTAIGSRKATSRQFLLESAVIAGVIRSQQPMTFAQTTPRTPTSAKGRKLCRTAERPAFEGLRFLGGSVFT
jgi:hypothetical protein